MLGLASVRASVSQFVSALYVSRLRFGGNYGHVGGAGAGLPPQRLRDPPGDVVDEQSAGCAAVIAPGHRPAEDEEGEEGAGQPPPPKMGGPGSPFMGCAATEAGKS